MPLSCHVTRGAEQIRLDAGPNHNSLSSRPECRKDVRDNVVGIVTVFRVQDGEPDEPSGVLFDKCIECTYVARAKPRQHAGIEIRFGVRLGTRCRVMYQRLIALRPLRRTAVRVAGKLVGEEREKRGTHRPQNYTRDAGAPQKFSRPANRPVHPPTNIMASTILKE